MSLAIVVVTLLYAFYRLRVRRLAAELNVRFDERLAERTRIAQDLHDTLLQGLVSSSMQLHFVTADVTDPGTRSRLEGVLSRISDVVEDGRKAVMGLRTSTSDDLEKAFARDAELFRSDRSIDIQIVVRGERRPLYPLIRDGVYQIGREALANAFKHAKATRVEIDLEYAPDGLTLLVRDDGSGVDADVIAAGRSGHWGLQGIARTRGRAGGHPQTLEPGQRRNRGRFEYP